MGHDTYYRLTVLEEDGVTEVYNPLLNEELVDENIPIARLIDGDTGPLHWYSSERQLEMLALSKKYPHYVFDLTGDGEESADIWNEFYWNGNFYDWILEYELPRVDMARLKDARSVWREPK